MRQYELVYLISDSIAEADTKKICQIVKDYIANDGGKIERELVLGRRKLAYPIKKENFATYVVVNFALSSENIKNFEHELKTSNEIVRHLIIVKDFGKEKLNLTEKDIVKDKEIQEVIGSEKSFEAIDGTKEESYELMSKRKAEEIEEAKEPDAPAKIIVETKEKEEEENAEKEVEEEKAEEIEEEKEEAKAKQIEKIEKTEISKIKKIEEKKKEIPEEKTMKKVEKAPKKIIKKDDKKIEDEVDRLTKLDKELDEILGDDL